MSYAPREFNREAVVWCRHSCQAGNEKSSMAGARRREPEQSGVRRTSPEFQQTQLPNFSITRKMPTKTRRPTAVVRAICAGVSRSLPCDFKTPLALTSLAAGRD